MKAESCRHILRSTKDSYGWWFLLVNILYTHILHCTNNHYLQKHIYAQKNTDFKAGNILSLFLNISFSTSGCQEI
jgi:hypothetical protein